MDFTGRSPQTSPTNQNVASVSGNSTNKKAAKASRSATWLRWGMGVLGLLLVALVVALIVAIGFGDKKQESGYLDKNKLQAVFLNTGQVYFGNVKSLTSKYFVVDNIYYLQTSSTGTSTANQAASTNVSLVKLGCELHSPYDQMVINRDQVTFWENLQDNGQVAKAVATFEKNNPNGQKCADQSAAPNTNSNVQNNTNTTQNTTTNTTTTKTP